MNGSRLKCNACSIQTKPNNMDDQNNVKHEAIRYFRNKKKKIHDLDTNSKIKNIKDMYIALVTLRMIMSLGLI
jgi:hypothetical protein